MQLGAASLYARALPFALVTGETFEYMTDNRCEYLLKHCSAHNRENDLAGEILRGDNGAR